MPLVKTDGVISRMIGTILDSEPYYTPFVSLSQFISIKDDILMGVAWTGTHIQIAYNEAKLLELPPEQRIYVLKHEYAHYYLKHVSERRRSHLLKLAEEKFPNLTEANYKSILNIVMDLEINSMLGTNDRPAKSCNPEDMGMPQGLLAQEYLILLDPDELKEKARQRGEKGETGDFDQDDIDADGELVDEIGDQDIEKRLKEAQSRGNEPGGLARIMAKLNPPKLAWKSILRKRLIDTLRSRMIIPTYGRSNRRGLLSPGRIFKHPPMVYVFQDTSGSVSSEDLVSLSSELSGIRRNAKAIKVVVIDAAIQDVYMFKGKIESVRGGGGSDFNPAFDLVNDEYRNGKKPIIILLTDGDISVPDKSDVNAELFWILCQGDRDVPYGKKIVLDK